jgi:hypothetical protein
MNRESLIEWASHWVSDETLPNEYITQRQRFVAGLTNALKDWQAPPESPSTPSAQGDAP